MSSTKVVGLILIILSVLIVGFVLYKNSEDNERIFVFSDKEMLSFTWENYKAEYIEEGTFRTLDRQQNDITTSEGQSYTLLRAVWMDDKETFDGALDWTNTYLRRDDGIFSWLYGERPDGSYGIFDHIGGENTASDADTDIALALIFAYSRWNEDRYLNQAKEVLEGIWEKEIVIIQGRPYLTANNLEATSSKSYVIVNPSYFAPYAYRIFARVDVNGRDWNALINTSYEVIEESIRHPLDTGESAGLPPNWMVIDKGTGEIGPPTDAESNLSTDYGFDALRIPWRIALDYLWYEEERAKNILKEMKFLSDVWGEQNKIAATYAHNGNIVLDTEAAAMYGAAIGYFLVADEESAHELYESKIKFLYDPDKKNWSRNLSYYDSNWIWFGAGLYTDNLPNLAASIM